MTLAAVVAYLRLTRATTIRPLELLRLLLGTDEEFGATTTALAAAEEEAAEEEAEAAEEEEEEEDPRATATCHPVSKTTPA